MRIKPPLRLSDDLDEPDFRNPVVFRVLARDVRGAAVAFVAAAGVGLLALGLWGALVLRILAAGPAVGRAAVGGVVLLALAGATLAAVRHLRLRASCSDPACEGAPGPDDALCPCCGAEIVGTVSRARDGFAAEEWYRIRLVRSDGAGGPASCTSSPAAAGPARRTPEALGNHCVECGPTLAVSGR